MSTITEPKLLPVVRGERLYYYRPGGYHPVHLNDTFKDGQYKVVHKLGYGAYATVWLVYDNIFKRYASLKILAAEVSDSHPEIAVLRHLQQHGTGSGKEYVVEVFDFFEHSGPNGIHQCIVMEVLGPPICSDIEILYPNETFPINIVKRMSGQLAHGLAYIHKAGIVHGDLHMANVLLHSPTIASWSSQSDVEMYLGVPRQAPILFWDTEEPVPPSPHKPSYIVRTTDPSSLLQLCLSNPNQAHVKICDFSEAFITAMQSSPLPRHMPVVYSAPEVIFGDLIGPPADIWALAALMPQLISHELPFPSYYGIRKEVIRAMVWTLGKLPEKWWSKWEERGEYFNEDGEWIGDDKKKYRHYDQLLVVESYMDEAEIPAFEELIRRMVRYEPKERASIDEVIEWMDQNGWI